MAGIVENNFVAMNFPHYTILMKCNAVFTEKNPPCLQQGGILQN